MFLWQKCHIRRTSSWLMSALMSAGHERSWALMSAHCERSWAIDRSRAHGKSAVSGRERSWALMSAQERSWALMSTPAHDERAHERSWALMSAYERSWAHPLMSAPAHERTRSWALLLKRKPRYDHLKFYIFTFFNILYAHIRDNRCANMQKHQNFKWSYLGFLLSYRLI